jgi:hypothetical protein
MLKAKNEEIGLILLGSSDGPAKTWISPVSDIRIS